MEDAVEFSIGGNNKGFVAVLNDTEKKAKDASGRVTKELDKVGANGLKGKAKITADLDSIAGDFAKVTSLSDGLNAAISKIGFKSIAGFGTAVAVATAFGKAAFDANKSANELGLTIERIGRKNRGGVAGQSMSDIEANLASSRVGRKSLLDSEKNINTPGAFREAANFADGAKTAGRDLLVTGNAFSGDTAKQEEKLRKEEEASLVRIGEKQQLITNLERERVKGSTEQAEIMALQLEYEEKLGKARDGGRGSMGQVQALTDERSLKIQEVQRQAAITRLERSRVGNQNYIQGRDAGKGNAVDIAAGDLSYAKEAAKLAGTDEEKETAELAVKSAEAALIAAKKENEERKAILSTERQMADFRGSAVETEKKSLELQVQLAEKLLTLAKGTVEQETRSVELAKSKKALQEFQLQMRMTAIGDNSDVARAKIGNLSGRKGLGIGDEQATRLSLNANIQKAQQGKLAADSALELRGDDPNLQKQAALAAEAVTAATIERDKWERDIARSKAEQLKMIEAELVSTRLTMQGKTIEAGLVTKIAASEIAAQKAIYAGNTALAQRITQQGQLLLTQEKYNRLIDASTGKLKPAAERSNDIRERRLLQRNTARSQRRLESTGGLTRVKRDSSGRIISGVDPDTGFRVAPKPGTGGPTNQIPSTTGGGTNFEEELKQRGSAGGGTSFKDDLKPRGIKSMLDRSAGTASDEMGAKQAGAQAKADQLSNTNKVAQQAQSGQSGGGVDGKLDKIIQALNDMNK